MAFYYWNHRSVKDLKKQQKRLERQIEIEEALERKKQMKNKDKDNPEIPF